MLRIFMVGLTLTLMSSGSALARDPLFGMETTSEARQRHSQENRDYYQRHGTPLAGYPEKLNDPAPRGTDRPGYLASPYGDAQDETYASSRAEKGRW